MSAISCGAKKFLLTCRFLWFIKFIILPFFHSRRRNNTCSNFFFCQMPKPRVAFVQFKPILDIVLHVFSLSICPQHRLEVLWL